MAWWYPVRADGRGGLASTGVGNRLAMSASTPPQLGGILFDRDGTLVADVVFNTDPERVVPLRTAAAAVRRARAAGLRVGVATNQPGLATGELDPEGMRRVNARINAVLGPFDWFICSHAKGAGCACRKPEPGLIVQAADAWGIEPDRLGLIGDTRADLEAAHRAGARAVLVPNARTLPEEIAAAPEVATTLLEAVERLLAPPREVVAPCTELGGNALLESIEPAREPLSEARV
jgi:histidinol-phosphate phosphatase family protein